MVIARVRIIGKHSVTCSMWQMENAKKKDNVLVRLEFLKEENYSEYISQGRLGCVLQEQRGDIEADIGNINLIFFSCSG